MIRRVIFTLILTFTSLDPLWADTIKEIITSDPPGADIYWGKTESKLLKTGIKTPSARSIEAKSWESWCYQVKMDGYYDSEIDSRPIESGDRKLHFILIPKPTIKEIITSDPPGADIYWGKTEYELEKSGLKTPNTRKIEGTSWEPYCYQVRKNGYIDSKIECRPEEYDERKLSFKLSTTPEKLKEEQEKEVAAYIAEQKKSSELEPKDSFSDKAYDYFNRSKSSSLNPEEFLTTGTYVKESINFLENAVKENPYYHAAYYILGLSYLRNENYKEAEKNLIRSIDLKPKFQPAYEKLGDLYLSQDQNNLAVQYYNRALENGKPTLNIYYRLGHLYLQSGQLENSESSYLNALNMIGNKRPKSISRLSYYLSIHNALAEVYLKKGELKKSWEHLKISSASDDELIPLYERYASRAEFYSHLSLGQIYYLSNRYKNAVYYFEKAIEIDSDSFNYYYELGRACKILKQYEKAMKYLYKVLELDPDHYYANLQMGIMLVSTKSNNHALNIKPDYEKAIQFLNKAIGINSSDALPFYYLGKAYLRIGRLQDALNQTKKARAIEPDYITFKQLGDIYLELNDYSGAVGQYRNAMALNDNSSIRLSIADCLILLRDYDETITLLNESIQIYPNNTLFLNRLGDVYVKKGEIETAISIYKQTSEIDPNNFHAQFEIAVAYFRLNRLNEAEKYFLKTTSINSESFAANYNCGIYYIKKKKYNYALRYLIKALAIRPNDSKTKEMINRYQHKIDITTLPKLKSLSQKDNEQGAFSKLLLYSVDYNKGNDLWIIGTQETEFKDGKNIVSPKINEALGYFTSIKDQIVKSSNVKGKIGEAFSFLSIALDNRISGIKQHSEGYYKKESDYDGEYEKGRAKIGLANDNYVDFLILLQEIGMDYKSVYDDLVKVYLEYNIEYYKNLQ